RPALCAFDCAFHCLGCWPALCGAVLVGHPGLVEGRPACWAVPFPDVAWCVASVLDPACGGAVFGPGLVCCERGPAEGARLVVGGAVTFTGVVAVSQLSGPSFRVLSHLLPVVRFTAVVGRAADAVLLPGLIGFAAVVADSGGVVDGGVFACHVFSMNCESPRAWSLWGFQAQGISPALVLY